MITLLRISNYALIRQLEFAPGPGFNIITGETGAGKSIILGALSLLTGRRLDSRSISRNDEKSMVEAVFEVDAAVAAGVDAVLAEAGFTPDSAAAYPSRSFTLCREIMPSGRSRASVNGQPVQLAVLGAVADLLVDIHSQHKNLLLADPEYQRQILDTLAENDALLNQYAQIYADYRVALKKFADTRAQLERTSADADYLEFQLGELSALNLVAGEEEDLEQQRESMANAASIGEQLSTAAAALSWQDSNASDLVSSALQALREAADLSPEFIPLADRLDSLRTELDDIADSVADHAQNLRDEPRSLEEIEVRLHRIKALKSKHRVDSVDQLIALRDDLSSRLAVLADSDAILHTLETDARALKRRALEKANAISARRKTAASTLAATLENRARPLGMDNLKVDVAVTSGKLNAFGFDTVEFLFSFNKNQMLAPVGSRASGGEISRVMLALKSIVAEYRHLPTVIFDEIDTGVSGDVANRMGALMASIGQRLQVLTITHLPQVAALGSKHFKVFKLDDDTSTATHLRLLSDDDRRAELALMLSGDPADATALAAADALLRHSQNS